MTRKERKDKGVTPFVSSLSGSEARRALARQADLTNGKGYSSMGFFGRIRSLRMTGKERGMTRKERKDKEVHRLCHPRAVAKKGRLQKSPFKKGRRNKIWMELVKTLKGN